MKVCVAGRMDHSKYLAEGLDALGLLSKYLTFGAYNNKPGYLTLVPEETRKKILNRRLSIASDKVHTSTSTYLQGHLIVYLYKKYGLDIRNHHHLSFEKYCANKIPGDIDILHYWSLYFDKSIRHFRDKYPNLIFLSDVYESYPLGVKETIVDEYDKLGIVWGGATNLTPEIIYQRYNDQNNFIVPSNYTRDTFTKYFPQKKFFVNPYGIYNPKFIYKKNYSNSRQIKFIYCGTVCIEKGSHYILEIAKRFPQHQFTLVGYVDQNIKLIKEQYASLENIKFVGHVWNGRINELLLENDVYIHPSLSDSFSLAVGEAISAGLPAIVSENTGIGEVLKSYEIGETFKTADIDSLTEAIQGIDCEWINNKRSRMEKVLNELSWDNYVKRTIGIYETLLSAGR